MANSDKGIDRRQARKLGWLAGTVFLALLTLALGGCGKKEEAAAPAADTAASAPASPVPPATAPAEETAKESAGATVQTPLEPKVRVPGSVGLGGTPTEVPRLPVPGLPSVDSGRGGGGGGGVEEKPGVSVADGIAANDKAVANLLQGNITFAPEREMSYGESSNVTVEISLTASPEELTAKFRSMSDAEGKPAVFSIKIAEKMGVELKGDHFDITLIEPQSAGSGGLGTQPLTSGILKWKWSVAPKELGVLKLNLAVYAYAMLPDGQERIIRVNDESSEEAKIRVKVLSLRSAWAWARANWNTLAAIVGTLGGALVWLRTQLGRRSTA